MASDPRLHVTFSTTRPTDGELERTFAGPADDVRQHAQGGDLPPVVPPPTEDPIEQARLVFESVAAKADAAKHPLGRLELVTVLGFGGLPLQRMIVVVDATGQVLAGTAAGSSSEAEVLGAWQKICAIMADAFDDASGTYYFERTYLDEQGRPRPAPPKAES